MTIVDVIFPVMFLAALILVRAARPALTEIDSTGYNKLSLGLSLFAALSLFNMLFTLDSVSALFTPKSMFWPEFVGWAGALAGVTLVASGVSSALPLIRQHREEGVKRKRNADLLIRVQEMADDESLSLDKLLAISIRDMATTFSFKSFAVFTFSRRRGGMALKIVANSYDETASEFCTLADIDKTAFLDMVEGRTPLTLQTLQSENDRAVCHPDTVLPILVNNQPVGHYLLWDENIQRAEETISALGQCASIVARRVERDRLKLKGNVQSHWIDLIGKLNRLSATSKSLTEFLPAVQAELSELTTANTIVISILDFDSKKLNRFTVGPTGSVLLERNLTLTVTDMTALAIGPEGSMVTINNLARIGGPQELTRQLLTPYSTRGSLCAYRLGLNHARTAPNQNALVGFYSERSSAFMPKDELLLGLLRSLLNEAVSRESFQAATLSAETDIASLRQLITGLSAVGGSKVELQNTVSFLLRGNNIDAVRISLVDGRNFLESKALACRTAPVKMLPASGIQILSLMPGHKRAINSGRTVILDRVSETDYCSPSESAQMLDSSVASALICPIVIDGAVAGTLTLMSNDESGALLRSVKMVEYMTAVSSLIGLSLTWQGERVTMTDAKATTDEMSGLAGKSFERRHEGMSRTISDPYLFAFESVLSEDEALTAIGTMTGGVLPSDSTDSFIRD